jgi:hypothetical protein
MAASYYYLRRITNGKERFFRVPQGTTGYQNAKRPSWGPNGGTRFYDPAEAESWRNKYGGEVVLAD